MANKYNKTFNKKIHTFTSENAVQNSVPFARRFLPEMSTFQNHKKYGPSLPKKQINDLVVSCVFLIDFYWFLMNKIKFIIFVSNPFIWWFIRKCLQAKSLFWYSEPRLDIFGWTFVFELTVVKKQVFGYRTFLELQKPGDDRRPGVSSSVEGLRVL